MTHAIIPPALRIGALYHSTQRAPLHGRARVRRCLIRRSSSCSLARFASRRLELKVILALRRSSSRSLASVTERSRTHAPLAILASRSTTPSTDRGEITPWDKWISRDSCCSYDAQRLYRGDHFSDEFSSAGGCRVRLKSWRAEAGECHVCH
jgi:hypothetical protein